MNPIDALDASVVMQFRHPQPMPLVARAKLRGKTKHQVLACQSCELYREQTDCHPIPFRGPSSASFVVVMESPPAHRIDADRRLLRALFDDVGIDTDDEVLWVDTVACVPYRGDTGEVRHPTDIELLACRVNLMKQVRVAGSPYVLFVGARPLNTFRSDLRVTDHHGNLYVWNDTYACMAIVHPGAGQRGGSGFKKLIREDLARWRDIVYGGDDPLAFIGTVCTQCKMEASHWDRDGVPYCGEHFKKWEMQWMKDRKRWQRRPIVQLSL